MMKRTLFSRIAWTAAGVAPTMILAWLNGGTTAWLWAIAFAAWANALGYIERTAT